MHIFKPNHLIIVVVIILERNNFINSEGQCNHFYPTPSRKVNLNVLDVVSNLSIAECTCSITSSIKIMYFTFNSELMRRLVLAQQQYFVKTSVT